MELHSVTGRLVAPKVIGGGPGLVSPDLVDALGEASMQLQATLLLNRYHRVAWGGAEGQSGTTPLEVAGSQDCGRNPKRSLEGRPIPAGTRHGSTRYAGQGGSRLRLLGPCPSSILGSERRVLARIGRTTAIATPRFSLGGVRGSRPRTISVGVPLLCHLVGIPPLCHLGGVPPLCHLGGVQHLCRTAVVSLSVRVDPQCRHTAVVSLGVHVVPGRCHAAARRSNAVSFLSAVDPAVSALSYQKAGAVQLLLD